MIVLKDVVILLGAGHLVKEKRVALLCQFDVEAGV